MSVDGRFCPLSYQYRPEELSGPAVWSCDTLYVVGGLYGNVPALRGVLDRVRGESAGKIAVVFNGDFHFLDCDREDFRTINETVLRHHAIQGNVEAALTDPDGGAGCDCAYPDYIDDATVERSNAIADALHRTARPFPELLARLAALPRHLTVEVAGHRVGIVHGDPESLAGWKLALEAIEPGDRALRQQLGWRGQPTTPQVVASWFRRCRVDVIASTHTGLAYAQGYNVDGWRRLVINNGSAGLPNFQGTTFGVITRLSGDPAVPPDALYGTSVRALRCDALPVNFDTNDWTTRFLQIWPPGSAGHKSYFGRISHGPHLDLHQAARCGGETSLARTTAQPGSTARSACKGRS
jgi:hypothetical protein